VTDVLRYVLNNTSEEPSASIFRNFLQVEIVGSFAVLVRIYISRLDIPHDSSRVILVAIVAIISNFTPTLHVFSNFSYYESRNSEGGNGRKP
jgi:hypothetical protein